MFGDLLIIATGSEVSLGLSVWQAWHQQGRQVRLVSMPCAEAFARQDQSYRHAVLPPAVERRLVIEAGSSAWWYRYAGQRGCVWGLDTYGASAPGDQALAHFGFDSEAILADTDKLFS